MFFLTLSFSTCKAQKVSESEKLKLVTEFIDAVRSKKNSNEEIIHKFLPPGATKEKLELEHTLINALRAELEKNDVELKFMSYYKGGT